MLKKLKLLVIIVVIDFLINITMSCCYITVKFRTLARELIYENNILHIYGNLGNCPTVRK
jgi:hypothetical protein